MRKHVQLDAVEHGQMGPNSVFLEYAMFNCYLSYIIPSESLPRKSNCCSVGRGEFAEKWLESVLKA